MPKLMPTGDMHLILRMVSNGHWKKLMLTGQEHTCKSHKETMLLLILAGE